MGKPLPRLWQLAGILGLSWSAVVHVRRPLTDEKNLGPLEVREVYPPIQESSRAEELPSGQDSCGGRGVEVP